MRVSAVRGREGESFLSPDVQREKIEAWAAYRGYTIVEWYIDLDVSGRTMRRPDFDRLMTDARGGRFDAVAVYRLTRFGRTVRGVAEALDELETLDVGLVSVTEDIDTTTAGGKFMRNVLFAMSEFESERVGEEWKNVHASRRARGIAHVARPMFGYRIEGAELAAVDETEAPAVRLAFSLRADGAGYGTIRRELHARGHRPKGGGTHFALSSLQKMLANPLYAGLVRLGDGTLLDATHEAIVSRAQWEAVQALASRIAETSRFRGGLLSGIIICGSCGYRMQREQRSGRPAIYRCVGHTRSTTCPHAAAIVAPAADDYVEERFLRRLNAATMPNRGQLKATRRQQEWTRRAARLRARADELTRALDGLADRRYMKGSLAADEYERQFSRYATERSAALAEAEELDSRANRVQPIDRDVVGRWPAMPLEVKQRTLRTLIEAVVCGPAPSQGGRISRGVNVRERLRIGWIA